MIPGFQLKSRDFEFVRSKGVSRTPFGSNTTDLYVVGRQTTWSKDNLWNLRNRLVEKARETGKLDGNYNVYSTGDIGSAFETVKHDYESSHPEVHVRSTWLGAGGYGNGYAYDGPLFAVAGVTGPPNFTLFPSVPADMSADMIAKGSTAIARTIPTHPAVGVAQFLGELKEGLPSVPGRKLVGSGERLSAKLADEYLNLEFGLRPIISDLRAFKSAMEGSNKTLQQLKRDSGRLVRRTYRFPSETTTELLTTRTGAYFYPSFHVSLYDSSGGVYTKVRTTTKDTWFSGAYTYHYDQGHDLWSKATQAEQNMNRLFGLRISPEVLWELAPWSWAADWVTNIGDVMTNLSAFSRDRLVMPWGYVMQKISITDTHTLTAGLKSHGMVSATQSFKTTVKKRVKATPYGFGLNPDWSSFTTRQLAILSALGITRAAR